MGNPAIELRQNHPNPFRLGTTIGFSAPVGSPATLKISDMQGKTLEVLFSGKTAARDNEVRFTNNRLASGNYLYTLTVEGVTTSRLMTITN